MNKLLVIGDIHGREFWKKPCEKLVNEVDKVIFLGDYIDPYPWEFITRKQAIQILRDVIEFKQKNMDKVILLLGNHDCCYVDKNFITRSRYDSSNAWTINEIFKSHRSLFQLAYEEEINNKKYLFTHAGLMPLWYEQHKDIIGELTVENLNHLLYFGNGIEALCDVSIARGGYSPCGSIVWSDVNERRHINGDVEQWDYQVFGHTQQEKYPIITKTYACLDCRQAFILHEDGLLEDIQNEKEAEK